MTNKRKIVIAGASVLALGAGAAGVAVAGGGGDSEQPIDPAQLDRASAAALEHTGGGTVSDTEVGDEESYYEVEVTLEDGSQTDVQLDKGFNVVGSEGDGPGEDEGTEDEASGE